MSEIKIVVGSTNPVKTKAAEIGFQQMFPGMNMEIISVKASSGIDDQPKSDQETKIGAHNRAHHARYIYPGADYYVGLEGGVEDHDGLLHKFAWVVVVPGKNPLFFGQGKTATFILPQGVRGLVLEGGLEAGDACDKIFGEQNSKQKMGAIGLLTEGVIDRVELYRHAVVLALIPFLKWDMFK